jgi:DNA-binding transcriptional LysR family regulator
LPPLVRAFRGQHADIKLELHNVTGKDGLALLRSDQVDFAIGSMLDVPNDLSYEPVYSYDPMLILPLDHPLLLSPAAPRRSRATPAVPNEPPRTLTRRRGSTSVAEVKTLMTPATAPSP